MTGQEIKAVIKAALIQKARDAFAALERATGNNLSPFQVQADNID